MHPGEGQQRQAPTSTGIPANSSSEHPSMSRRSAGAVWNSLPYVHDVFFRSGQIWHVTTVEWRGVETKYLHSDALPTLHTAVDT